MATTFQNNTYQLVENVPASYSIVFDGQSTGAGATTFTTIASLDFLNNPQYVVGGATPPGQLLACVGYGLTYVMHNLGAGALNMDFEWRHPSGTNVWRSMLPAGPVAIGAGATVVSLVLAGVLMIPAVPQFRVALTAPAAAALYDGVITLRAN